MEIATIVELVSGVGFPIAACVGMGYFIYYMVKKNSETNAANMQKLQARCIEREEKLFDEIKECREINGRAIETIAHYAEKLDTIQQDVKEIKNDVISIMAKQGGV